MRVTAQKLNRKGLVVNNEKFREAYSKYIKLYNRCSLELYNLGFLHKLYFDDIDFKYILLDTYKSEVFNLLTNRITGELIKQPLVIKYIARDIEDLELQYVLNLYADICRCQEAFEVYDRVLDKCRLAKRSNLSKVSPYYIVSGSAYDKSPARLSSEYILEIVEETSGKTILEEPYNKGMLKVLCEDLGLESSIFESAKANNKAIFIEDCSFEDECLMLWSVINGDFNHGTSYYDMLLKRIDTYYKEFTNSNTTNVVCLPYSEYIFTKGINYNIEYLNTFRESNPTYEEVLMTESTIYYIVDSIEEVSDNLEEIWIGSGVLDTFSGRDLGKRNCLNGWFGEFISESEVKKFGFKAKGLPVKLYVSDDEKAKVELFYPIYNVVDEDGKALVPKIGDSINFIFSDIQNILKKYGVKTIDEFETKMESFVALRDGSIASLSARLIRGLINIECDTSDDIYSPNKLNVKGLNCADFDLFTKASFEAIGLFNSIDF